LVLIIFWVLKSGYASIAVKYYSVTGIQNTTVRYTEWCKSHVTREATCWTLIVKWLLCRSVYYLL